MQTLAAPLGLSREVDAALPRAIPANRRRHIGRDAGRALEILGHAIEYLADEYAFAGKSLTANDPRVQAMQILMARNRDIYFACPVVPSLGKQLRAWLRRIPLRREGAASEALLADCQNGKQH